MALRFECRMAMSGSHKMGWLHCIPLAEALSLNISEKYSKAVNWKKIQFVHILHKLPMIDWAGKLDAFLKFNDAEILQGNGKVTAEIAKAFAESEFEQYRVLQDSLYKSDFDKLCEEMN